MNLKMVHSSLYFMSVYCQTIQQKSTEEFHIPLIILSTWGILFTHISCVYTIHNST
jgi:hypothetical protein